MMSAPHSPHKPKGEEIVKNQDEVLHTSEGLDVPYTRSSKSVFTKTRFARFLGYKNAGNKEFHGVIKALVNSGAVEIQQGGYLGDSIHHPKLVVIRKPEEVERLKGSPLWPQLEKKKKRTGYTKLPYSQWPEEAKERRQDRERQRHRLKKHRYGGSLGVKVQRSGIPSSNDVLRLYDLEKLTEVIPVKVTPSMAKHIRHNGGSKWVRDVILQKLKRESHV